MDWSAGSLPQPPVARTIHASSSVANETPAVQPRANPPEAPASESRICIGAEVNGADVLGFRPGGNELGVAIAARPADGTYETGQTMLTEIAAAVQRHMPAGGSC